MSAMTTTELHVPAAATSSRATTGLGGGGFLRSLVGRFSTGPSRYTRLLLALQGKADSQDDSSTLGHVANPTAARSSALSELCNLLTVGGSEETLFELSVDDFVPVLVKLLEPSASSQSLAKGSLGSSSLSQGGATAGSLPVSDEDMLLSCSALTLLLDLQPFAASVAVRCKAVSFLCTHLINISYIDLAEQCLQALRRLARTHPKIVLREGGLRAALFHLSFFPINMQRQAVETAASLCRKVPTDAQSHAAMDDALPVLTELLGHTDAQVVASACLCFTLLAESDMFCIKPSAWSRPRDIESSLQHLAAHGLIHKLVLLVTPASNQDAAFCNNAEHNNGDSEQSRQRRASSMVDVNGECRMQAFHLMADLCGQSTALTEQAVSVGVARVVLETLSPAEHFPPQMLLEVLRLVNALLPPLLPQVAMRVPPLFPLLSPKGCCSRSEEQNAAIVLSLGHGLLARCIYLVEAPPSQAVRHSCVVAATKLLFGCEGNTEALQKVTGGVGIERFICSLLSALDGALVCCGLELAALLMGDAGVVLNDATESGESRNVPTCPFAAPFKENLKRHGIIHVLAALARAGSGSDTKMLSRSAQVAMSSLSEADAAQIDAFYPFSASPWTLNMRTLHWLRAKGVTPTRQGEKRYRHTRQLQQICGGKAEQLLRAHFADSNVACDVIKSLSNMSPRSVAGWGSGKLSPAKVHPVITLIQPEQQGGGAQATPAEPRPTSVHKDVAEELRAVAMALCGANGMLSRCSGEEEELPRDWESAEEEHEDAVTLDKLCDLLCREGDLTAFELLRSGVIGSLVQFLAVPNVPCSGHDRRRRRDFSLQWHLRRVQLVIRKLLARDRPSGNDVESELPFLLLVQKLQEALDIVQRFPVRVFCESDLNALRGPKVSQPTPSAVQLSDQLRALACPFSIRARYDPHAKYSANGKATDCAVESSKNSSDITGRGSYSNTVVMVEPLATVMSVRDQIKKRERTRTAYRATPSPSTDSVAATGNSDNSQPTQVRGAHRSGNVKQPDTPASLAFAGTNAITSAEVEASTSSSPIATNTLVTSDAPSGTDIISQPADRDSHDAFDATESVSSILTEEESDLDRPSACSGGGESSNDHQAPPRRGNLPLDPGENSKEEIVVFMGGHALLPSTTIFEAICRYYSDAQIKNQPAVGITAWDTDTWGVKERDPDHWELLSSLEEDFADLWVPEYEVTYRYVERSEALRIYKSITPPPKERKYPRTLGGAFGPATRRSRDPKHRRGGPSHLTKSYARLVLKREMVAELPPMLSSDRCPCVRPARDILVLLRMLSVLNQHWRIILAEGSEVASECDGSALKLRSVTNVEFAAAAEEARGTGAIPWEEFRNRKITNNLKRQLQDPLALCPEALPVWIKGLVFYLPCLFGFEERKQLLYTTAFGITRALHQLQRDADAQSESEIGHRAITRRSTRDSGFFGALRVGRLQRQKVRVSRDELLDAAARVMGAFSTTKSLLEVEFFGEAGTGSGPTAEFFVEVSRALQQSGECLWRNDLQQSPRSEGPTDNPDFEASNVQKRSELRVNVGCGLFPAPLLTAFRFHAPILASDERLQSLHILDRFEMMGSLVARALMDRRLIDLSFAPPFFKLLQGKKLNIFDLFQIDPDLASTIRGLCLIASRRRKILHKVWSTTPFGIPTDELEAAETDALARAVESGWLTYDGCEIHNLALNWTLPGYERVKIKRNGSASTVGLMDIEEYTEEVVSMLLYDGLLPQVNAFKCGFQRVMPLSALRAFASHELDVLLCGSSDSSTWSVRALIASTRCNHGYTKSSHAVVLLFEILSEFSEEEKALFLLFVTGAPRLPSGGLRALSPPLTIVHRSPHRYGLNADDCLPSVMTCTHYLKLPNYSTKSVAKARLLTAIREGCSAFHLS